MPSSSARTKSRVRKSRRLEQAKKQSKLVVRGGTGNRSRNDDEEEIEIEFPEPVKPVFIHPHVQCSPEDEKCTDKLAADQAKWDAQDRAAMMAYEREYKAWQNETKAFQTTRSRSRNNSTAWSDSSASSAQRFATQIPNDVVDTAFESYPTIESLKDDIGNDAWNLFIKLLMERGSFNKQHS